MSTKYKKALVIGAGPAGIAASHLLTLNGNWDITLVEKTGYTGGGCRTFEYGGHPFTFGPRHFLTQNEKTFEYLNKYCPMRDCKEHEFLTFVEKDNQFYNFPIHEKDFEKMPDKEKILKELKDCELNKDEIRFSPDGKIHGDLKSKENLEDFWIASVGKSLYEKYVKYYTQKMWMVEDNKVIDNFGWSPKGVTINKGAISSAWADAISAYPTDYNGYNKWFDLASSETKLLLNTTISKYDIPNSTVTIDGEKLKFDIIINTISPDILFDFCHGELPYIGRDLMKIILPIKDVFPKNVYFAYYAGKEKFTRIVDFKKLTNQNINSNTSLITIEMPSNNGKYYPLPLKSQISKAKKYLDEMPENVFSIGRAGSYDYGVDIDDSIEQAMEIINNL